VAPSTRRAYSRTRHSHPAIRKAGTYQARTVCGVSIARAIGLELHGTTGKGIAPQRSRGSYGTRSSGIAQERELVEPARPPLFSRSTRHASEVATMEPVVIGSRSAGASRFASTTSVGPLARIVNAEPEKQPARVTTMRARLNMARRRLRR
jgi:hypothetical protein